MIFPKLTGSKYAVTGAAGFIGSHICEEIVRQGKQVVAIDDLSNGKKANFEPWWDESLCTFVHGDITSRDIIKDMEGVDVVFNNAARKCTFCIEDPLRDLMVNAWGAFRVFEAAHAVGAKVVHASTGSVYGDRAGSLTIEDLGYNPKSFYGVSKLAGERYLTAFVDLYHDFRFSIIRYFHVFGPRQDWSDKGGVVPIFIRRIWEGKPITIFGDGRQVRSFTNVHDTVKANFILAEDSLTDNQAFDCASGVMTDINILAEMLMEIMGKTVPVIHGLAKKGDIYRFSIDNRKLRDIGMEFDMDTMRGLTDTVGWYLNEWS